MPVYHFQKWRSVWKPAVLFLVLFFAANSVFPLPVIADAADRILRLRPEQDHYYLGPHLDYLEDPSKKLTINDVSSPQMADRYIEHENRMLNLGLNSHAYWIRFDVQPAQTASLTEKWLLYTGWPNSIDHATLYMPDYPESDWSTRELGRLQLTDSDVMPIAPAVTLQPLNFPRKTRFYLRVESSDSKQLALQILTDKAYEDISRLRTLWFGVYHGIMLAMFLYNLILFFSLREKNRLYYLIYLFFVGLLFLASNGLLYEFFGVSVHLSRILVLVSVCLAFFWGNLFAKSFLITKKHSPFFDKLLNISMLLALVLLFLLPVVKLAWMTIAISIQSILVPPVFLLAAITTLKSGFRPARFFLIAFATLALSAMLEALVVFGVLPYLSWTRFSSQFGSAIEVILLQLALADRIKTLSREQEQIRQSLYLAREVQQNLLPHQVPIIDGLDIAGKSIYCDETGGDYYDFIIDEGHDDRSVGVAIGDVSGHGISSALLMATVRSSLRQRSSMPGGAAEVLSDVNRQLVRDVEDSGQFMTMFYLTIDLKRKRLHWVRAGHDPAICYDPEADAFDELGGPGVALGVVEDWEYEGNTKQLPSGGQIIFLSTDGIWEACNQKGEMFGKDPVYEIIRNHFSDDANVILEAILNRLNSFQDGATIEDDVTLVVVKIGE
jgi:serine phosphatase RsbU (regulator of sigma subunit)